MGQNIDLDDYSNSFVTVLSQILVTLLNFSKTLCPFSKTKHPADGGAWT